MHNVLSIFMYLLFNRLIYPSICLLFHVSNTCTSFLFVSKYHRGLLKISWTARTSNQSIVKEISPEYSLKGLMLKLTLQYLGHLMQSTDSFEKTLMLGKIEGRRRGQQRMRWLDGITDSKAMHEFGWTPGVGDGQGDLACCGSWGRKELHTTERLDWTEQ